MISASPPAALPAPYTNTLTVASVDPAGAIGPHLLVNDQALIYYESTDFGNQAMSNLDQTQDGSGTEYPFVYVNGFGAETDFDGIDLNGKVVFCSRGGRPKLCPKGQQRCG